MENYAPVHVTFLHCAEKRALQPEEYQLLMPLQGELTVTSRRICWWKPDRFFS